jgi:flagellar protein FlbD
VIILTRLGCGLQIAVNPDLIERIERTPDTIVTLIDGHKLVVEEPLEDVVTLVRTWRASVAAEAISLSRAVIPAVAIDETDAPAEMQDALLGDTAGRGSPLGRVLRLPSREV